MSHSYFFFFADGLSKFCFKPPACCSWNLRFCVVSCVQAASNCVVS